MVVEMRREQPIYTVKYTVAVGHQGQVDIPADGVSDAEQKFKKEFPEATLITIWRKQ